MLTRHPEFWPPPSSDGGHGAPWRSRTCGPPPTQSNRCIRRSVMRKTRLRTALRAAIAIPIVVAVAMAPSAHAQDRTATHDSATEYIITELGSLGGTSSAGISIDNRGWIAGSSNRPGDAVGHAALWRNGSLADLGTLGGPNSAVLWPVKNDGGIVVGVAETADTDPRGEAWSCSAFFPGSPSGHVCRGFVWQDGKMTPLPTLGGTHGFAAGLNNRGQAVGWAETAQTDPSCNAPQVLGFRAALWDIRRGGGQQLRPLASDTASAATAINDSGQGV